MNYYKRHIGDYAKKAGHLSVLEHGVYTLILDAYYDREQAPTRAEAVRQARARSPEEIAAVDAVLADFFKEVDGRFIQSRVEEEFVKAEQVAERNAARGKLGGRPRKPKGKPEESRRVSEQKPDESPEKPNPLIHQSIEEEQKPEHVPQAARFEEFWLAYPIKRGKKTARDKWKAKKLDAVADKLIADVHRRVAEDRQWRDGFAPHASTYLHQERWEDELAGRERLATGPPQLSKNAQAIHALEGLKSENRRLDCGTTATLALPEPGKPAGS